jgi:hypothetical protein
MIRRSEPSKLFCDWLREEAGRFRTSDPPVVGAQPSFIRNDFSETGNN